MNKSLSKNSKPFSSRNQDLRPAYQYKEFQSKQELAPKFKTQICKNLQTGYCEFGSKCLFAHSIEELQDRSGFQQKLIKCASFFQNGYCISGPRCQFSHRDTSPETAANSPKHSRKASWKSSDEQYKPIFIDLEARRIYN